MSSVRFEPESPAKDRPQTYAFDCSASEIGWYRNKQCLNIFKFGNFILCLSTQSNNSVSANLWQVNWAHFILVVLNFMFFYKCR